MPRKATNTKKKASNALEAFNEIGGFHNLSKDVIEDALSYAIEKAYRKRNNSDGAKIRTVVDEKGRIRAFRLWDVVETVEDPDYQLDLEEAKDITDYPQVGQVLEEETEIDNFVRGDISTVKSVMFQRIKDAERKEVIDKYQDCVGDMVTGIVQSVEERFVMVRLGADVNGEMQPGATDAIMRKSDMIPSEKYTVGQLLKVVITNVDKEAKGAIVMVSRSDTELIKRLFEKEVLEIYQGTVEIKAISRDAGQRAKMAVVSNRDNIDPIGACIGPGGSRVRAISEELNGEKIDIFKWSDDLQEFVCNALSPAQGIEVFLAEDAPEVATPTRNSRDGKVRENSQKSLVAAVPESQLSLAIGRRGQNAKLAFHLTGHHIDIRSQEDLDEMGVNWRVLVDKLHEEYLTKKSLERAYKQQQRIEELRNSSGTIAVMPNLNEFEEDEEFAEDNFDEFVDEPTIEQEEQATVEMVEETPVQQDVEEEAAEFAPKAEETEMEAAARIAKENRRSLAERRTTTYTSKFESAEPEKAESAKGTKPSKAKEEAKKEERRIEKKKPTFNAMHPIYTEDELEEIENAEIEEEMSASWNEDIDYEEYDSYYDDEY